MRVLISRRRFPEQGGDPGRKFLVKAPSQLAQDHGAALGIRQSTSSTRCWPRRDRAQCRNQEILDQADRKLGGSRWRMGSEISSHVDIWPERFGSGRIAQGRGGAERARAAKRGPSIAEGEQQGGAEAGFFFFVFVEAAQGLQSSPGAMAVRYLGNLARTSPPGGTQTTPSSSIAMTLPQHQSPPWRPKPAALGLGAGRSVRGGQERVRGGDCRYGRNRNRRSRLGLEMRPVRRSNPEHVEK